MTNAPIIKYITTARVEGARARWRIANPNEEKMEAKLFGTELDSDNHQVLDFVSANYLGSSIHAERTVLLEQRLQNNYTSALFTGENVTMDKSRNDQIRLRYHSKGSDRVVYGTVYLNKSNEKETLTPQVCRCGNPVEGAGGEHFDTVSLYETTPVARATGDGLLRVLSLEEVADTVDEPQRLIPSTKPSSYMVLKATNPETNESKAWKVSVEPGRLLLTPYAIN